jgi:oligopeptide transport system permease protein
MARIVRGQTLALKQREFIEAARAFGATDRRILWRHIIPNLWGPVIISMLLVIPDAILTESFLSFLGLGVQEPNTSWGVLIGDGAQSMTETPWMLLFPGAFLAFTLLAFNFVGDGLRDALDPRG